MSKRKVSVEDKTYAVNLYLDGKESQRRIADMFEMCIRDRDLILSFSCATFREDASAAER